MAMVVVHAFLLPVEIVDEGNAFCLFLSQHSPLSEFCFNRSHISCQITQLLSKRLAVFLGCFLFAAAELEKVLM